MDISNYMFGFEMTILDILFGQKPKFHNFLCEYFPNKTEKS